MPIVPLFGHADTRRRLSDAARRGALPASLLFHGPRGVGKQRLALWLAQLLLCENPNAEPCGACRGCRFALELTHPDLHWFFPRPRPKDGDPDLDDVRDDIGEAVRERADSAGLYEPPSGMEGIYVATARAIVRLAALSPALGKRKVIVVGDAERMAPQEGAEFGANAFLKLLEEPPGDTTIVLTSSEPGALLPTVRSRVVAFAVATLPDEEVAAFLDHEAVAERLRKSKALPAGREARIAFAAGAPGRLVAAQSWKAALEGADRLMKAATGAPLARYEVAWAQASTKARGAFADALDALGETLGHRMRDLAQRGADREALAVTRAIERVEAAKERVIQNVSPQLITANLVRELQELLA